MTEPVCDEVILIPLIAFDPVAADAVRLPTRLLATVTFDPPAMRRPLTVVPALVPPIS